MTVGGPSVTVVWTTIVRDIRPISETAVTHEGEAGIPASETKRTRRRLGVGMEDDEREQVLY